MRAELEDTMESYVARTRRMENLRRLLWTSLMEGGRPRPPLTGNLGAALLRNLSTLDEDIAHRIAAMD